MKDFFYTVSICTVFFSRILVMDFLNSAQDVVCCTVCQDPEDLMFCEVCHISLCKDCAEKHPYASENHTAVTHKQYLTNCPDRSLMDEPQIITTLDTEYGNLYGVTCVNDNEVWTCGSENTIKLYNLQEELLKSIQTESGNEPRDITMTKDGNLVYTDYKKGTVNMVKNSKIQVAISLQAWKPVSVCI